MKNRLTTLVVFVACIFAEAAQGGTVSEVRVPNDIPIDRLSELVSSPVVIQHGEGNDEYIVLPNDSVRKLLSQGIHLETLRTYTTLFPQVEEKALEQIQGYDGIGFPINPPNSGNIVISSAPPGAVVSSVTVRIRGTAPYADMCTFQLRDTANIPYTFPTWYDEFSFDHTVSNITAYNGRPVNQTWTLWGQGSNTSGERVNEWWITIFYESSPSEGEPPVPSVLILGPSRVEVGQNATLRGSWTSLQGALLFQWQKDGEILIGANEQDYFIPSATYDDAGTYVLFIEDESKALWESPPFVFAVLPEDSLPLQSPLMAGIITLLIAGIGYSRLRKRC